MKRRRPRIERIERQSAVLVAEQVSKLREAFPEAVTEGKVDFDKLRTTLGDEIDDRPERYSFNWAGKRDAIRLLQTPSRATLIPAPKESVNFEETNNIFIECENLEVLKLLHKSYFGRVKMIYIDPPYNTGNDFIYPDNYADPLANYLRLTGQKDSEGNLLTSNPETSGRYHSAWLSMMYPRLFLPRQLLRDDGVIFVSIDDHEVYNLRLVMNEIFGEENFIAAVVWKRRQVSDNRNINQVSTDHEYVLAYGKGATVFLGKAKDLSKYSNPDNDPRGPWMSDNMTGLATREQRPNLHYDLINPQTRKKYPPHASRGWVYEPETMNRLIAEGKVIWPTNPDGRPRLKRFLNEIRSRFTGFSSVQDVGYTTDGTREIDSLFGSRVFAFPKPVSLVRLLCEQATSSEQRDIVLDFFAGSRTTAHSLIELNQKDEGDRSFVLVQLPEPCDNKSFKTIAEIGKERFRRVIEKTKKQRNGKLDLGFKVFRLSQSNFGPWENLEEKDSTLYSKQMELYVDPLRKGWKAENVVLEVALKEGYSLTSKIEKTAAAKNATIYRVSDPEKQQAFRICLADKIPLGDLKSINLKQDDLFICRDVALDDEAAANLALQCSLKTI